LVLNMNQQSPEGGCARDVFSNGLLKDSVFLVTGGGSGIGESIAQMAGDLGARVAICGRTESKLRDACQGFGKRGIECMYGIVDIRDQESVATFVSQVIEKYGRIDHLINNAGGQYRTQAENCKPKGFNAVSQLCVSNTTTLCQMMSIIALSFRMDSMSKRFENVESEDDNHFIF